MLFFFLIFPVVTETSSVKKAVLINPRFAFANGTTVDSYIMNPIRFAIDDDLGQDGTYDHCAQPAVPEGIGANFYVDFSGVARYWPEYNIICDDIFNSTYSKLLFLTSNRLSLTLLTSLVDLIKPSVIDYVYIWPRTEWYVDYYLGW